MNWAWLWLPWDMLTLQKQCVLQLGAQDRDNKAGDVRGFQPGPSSPLMQAPAGWVRNPSTADGMDAIWAAVAHGGVRRPSGDDDDDDDDDDDEEDEDEDEDEEGEAGALGNADGSNPVRSPRRGAVPLRGCSACSGLLASC
jgi:hypothetical protein